MEEYTKANQKEKQAFRKNWAQCKLDEMRQLRTKKQAWEKIDTSKGTYVPYGILWQREGGRMDKNSLAA